MAPPRKHPTDRILDAARQLVLGAGPRGAGVAAIARESGAPVGTIYHRFGSRDGVLEAAWLRALERFQDGVLAAAETDDAVDAGAAMAASVVAFVRERPDDARLLHAVRRDDLLDARSDDAMQERLDAMNAPLLAQVRRVARALHGRADARSLDAVTRAIVDLPYATARRHARSGDPLPSWLEGDVAAATRTLLTAA